MESKISYDENRCTYIERDVNFITQKETQYRYLTIEFALDGTVISETEGEWISID